MIAYWVPHGSTYAADIDNVIILVGVIVGAWLIATEGIFFWLLWKFKAKPGKKAEYLEGHEKHVKKWISNSHMLVLVCDVFILVAAIKVWVNVKQELPEPDATVRIMAQQWAWSFQHPGPDGEIDTDDDIHTVEELHLEVGKVYHYKLEALDVMHSFSVPVFRLKQDAVPGRTITGWFEPTLEGTFDIQCAEMCGIGHGLMPARAIISSPAAHAAWQAEHASTFASN